MIGGGNADVYVLSDAVDTMTQADRIMGFNRRQGDRIYCGKGFDLNQIRLEAVDSDGNGIVDATLIRSSSSSNSPHILGLVLNSTLGSQSTLTLSDFV
jgi:Ca2+-binding RTX toxin-like protein